MDSIARRRELPDETAWNDLECVMFSRCKGIYQYDIYIHNNADLR